MIPPARPQLSIVDARKILAAYGVIDQVVIIGQRGYMRDSMGVAGKNDRQMYDDMIAILSPRVFKAFNANTDPSKQGGRLAVLQAGVWTMQPWTHHAGTPHEYPCLMQAGPVTVLRDNGIRETGMFDIEIHQGGYNTTGSLGCQTVWPDQYGEFKDLWRAEMAFYKMPTIEYVLDVRAAA